MTHSVSYEIEKTLSALEALQRTQIESLKASVADQRKKIDLITDDKIRALRAKHQIQKTVGHHFEEFKNTAQEKFKDVTCQGMLSASIESKKAAFYSKELFDSLYALFTNTTDPEVV